MPRPPSQDSPPSTRITVRIPQDWLIALDQVAKDLQVPGRGPTRVDAVRVLVLEALKERGIKVTSVVHPPKKGG